jgi:DinB superfamily
MARPDLSRAPEYSHVYINQVREDDLMAALHTQTPMFVQFLETLPVVKRDHRYAEGKWTIKEMLQHILDAERIFAYRALCFARKDTTSLPSFDENLYADNSKAGKRNWDELVEEFKWARLSNEIMFGSFDNEQLETTGTANNRSMYVLAVGFTLVGHVAHHLKVIKEKYL